MRAASCAFGRCILPRSSDWRRWAYFFLPYGAQDLWHPGRPSCCHSANNWYIVHNGWIAGPIDPLWSIAVEEQFYIAIPLLARYGGRRVLGVVSVLLLGISYGTTVHYARRTGVLRRERAVGQ